MILAISLVVLSLFVIIFKNNNPNKKTHEARNDQAIVLDSNDSRTAENNSLDIVTLEKNMTGFEEEFNKWCEERFYHGIPITSTTEIIESDLRKEIMKLCEKYKIGFCSSVVADIFNHMPYGRMIHTFRENVEKLMFTKRENYIKQKQFGHLAWDCISGIYGFDGWLEGQKPVLTQKNCTKINVEFFSQDDLAKYFLPSFTPKVFYLSIKKHADGIYHFETSPWLKLLHAFSGENFDSLLLTDLGRVPRKFTKNSLFFLVDEGDGDVQIQKFSKGPSGLDIISWIKNELRCKKVLFDHGSSKEIINSMMLSLGVGLKYS